MKQRTKQVIQITVAFMLGMMLFVGLDAYQQAQLDDEIWNAPYKLTIRLARRSGAFEFEDSIFIKSTDVNSVMVETFTLYKPANAEARQGQSSLVVNRQDWATYDFLVEGPNFDAFSFKILPNNFQENDPWQISSSIKLLYSDWIVSPDFIIWIGLGY